MQFFFWLFHGLTDGACRLLRLFGLACLIAIASTSASAGALKDVRFGAWENDVTRVVLDVEGAADYYIGGDGKGFGRLIIELAASSKVVQERNGDGHVARYAIIAAKDGHSRVILELGRTAKIKDHFLLPPRGEISHHRLVIDLATADKTAFLASIPRRYEDLTAVIEAATEGATVPTAAVTTAQYEPVVIVIDPGHGGSDPGALGQGGTKEKDVTLAAAQQLAEFLEEKGGYHIVMTRAGDLRLGLEERAIAARRAGADLFISLHADAHGDPKLRGGSVYTLSEEGGQRSAREARNQGDYHVYDVNINDHSPEVGGILFDLAQRKTKNESSHFADMLVAKLVGVTPLVNNSHRTADLFVLLAPDVPAILLELAFISNKDDEANLISTAWRKKTMAAVANSIDEYFEGKRSVRQAANAAKGAP